MVLSQYVLSQSRDHKTLLYTGAGLYKEFPLTESAQGQTSYALSGTLTFRPNNFVFLNTGIDLYNPESGRKIVVSLNFIPSMGFEEDNVLICVGAGGFLYVGEGGVSANFIAGFKAGYFFNKKYAASIEIKSPIHYDTHAVFLFTAGIIFVL